MLEKENAAHLLKDEASRLEAAVFKALSDGDGDVRVLARRGYLAFSALWPDRGARMWTRLEYGTQRQLEAERKEAKSALKSEQTDRKRDLDSMHSTDAHHQPPPHPAAAPAVVPTPTPTPVPAISFAHTLAFRARAPSAHASSPGKKARLQAEQGTTQPSSGLKLNASVALAANTARMFSAARLVQPKQ